MEKYKEKKLKNQVLARFIQKFLSESSWEYVQDCNTFMMMVADETLENKKQHKGNTCKNRFCPICSWKKARKDALALAIQMEYIKDTYNKEFIFLTLTTPNVKADELHNEIKEYNHAFQKLMQRKEVKSVVKGYVRKLEVTYNHERDDYNPHFHVLIAVNKSYFNDSKQYISQSRWLELWQQSTQNPSITNVHVQKVKANSKKEVAELAKYSAKDSDYLANEKVFDAFYKGLKGKQLVVYSGLFKESNKLFKDGELDHYKEQDPTEYIYALLYHWGNGNYVEDEKRLLTDDEKKEINSDLLSEEKDLSAKEYTESLNPYKTIEEIKMDELSDVLKGINNIDLPKLPDLSNVPEMSDLPKMPEFPDFSNIPKMSELPKIPKMPELPKLPKLPDFSNMPKMPELPRMPKLPEMPNLNSIINPSAELMKMVSDISISMDDYASHHRDILRSISLDIPTNSFPKMDHLLETNKALQTSINYFRQFNTSDVFKNTPSTSNLYTKDSFINLVNTLPSIKSIVDVTKNPDLFDEFEFILYRLYLRSFVSEDEILEKPIQTKTGFIDYQKVIRVIELPKYLITYKVVLYVFVLPVYSYVSVQLGLFPDVVESLMDDWIGMVVGFFGMPELKKRWDEYKNLKNEDEDED